MDNNEFTAAPVDLHQTDRPDGQHRKNKRVVCCTVVTIGEMFLINNIKPLVEFLFSILRPYLSCPGPHLKKKPSTHQYHMTMKMECVLSHPLLEKRDPIAVANEEYFKLVYTTDSMELR